MATSGGIVSQTLKSSNFYVNWQQTSQSVENNTTYINWQVGLNCNGNYWYSNAVRINYVKINGVEVFGSETYSNFYGGSYELANGTASIPHNSDGTKSFTVEVSGWLYSYGDTYGSGSFTLNTIPRASSMTVSSGTINSTKPKFTISRASNSFTHTIKYVTPGTSNEVQIASGVGTSYENWTPPDTLYQYFPNSKSITLTYKLYTYSGGTQVGSYTATGTINAKESECAPTVTSTVTPTDYSSITGSSTAIIKGMSNVTISATATPKKSATIKSIKTNGKTLSTNSTTGSGTIQAVETNVFTTVTTDSRGYTGQDKKTLGTLIPYIKLTVEATANRVNATSSTVKATVKGKYYNGNFSSSGVANTLTLTWKYKLRSASSYTTGGTLTATYSGGEFTTGEVTLGTNFPYDKDYDFQFIAKDKLLTKSTVIPINKGVPIFDYGVDRNGDNYHVINGDSYIYKDEILSKVVGQDLMTIACTRHTQTFTSSWTFYQITSMSTINSVGSKLTRDGNSIKIGKGVSKVLVSANCRWNHSSGADRCLQIHKNTTEILSTYHQNATEYITSSLIPYLLNVQENDLVKLGIESAIGSGSSATSEFLDAYLTVQVVE